MDFATCNKCSSQNGSITNGFPKKLLVATCVVLIIAMCLTPAEAGALRHGRRHEKRHEKEERTKTTKMSSPHHRNLHFMLARKIIKKLKNTKRYFEESAHQVKDSMEHRYGNPKWLPKVKFFDIHNQTYTALENGMSKEKFEYVIPKLYKNLVQFKLVWERLAEVKIKHLDTKFQMDYAETKRKAIISKTREELLKLLTEIEDAMDKADIAKPHINKLNLEGLKIDDVDTTWCLKQDTITIRAYGKTLKKWYWELRCPDDSNAKLAEQCRKVAQTLFSKRKTPGKQRQNKRQRRHSKKRTFSTTIP